MRHRHRHKWEIVAVQHETFQLDGNRTAVLHACTCGTHWVQWFPGHWTLEQLTAPTAKP